MARNSNWPNVFKVESSSTQRQINGPWQNLFKLNPSSPHRQINTSSTMSGKRLPADEGTSSSLEKWESIPPKLRWRPLPEQTEILEGIFKSGIENPGRQDMRSITKLLQKYGHVGEANIFYWFQNRKARIKKERPLESALPPEQMNGTSSAQYHNAVTMGGVIQSDSIMIHTGASSSLEKWESIPPKLRWKPLPEQREILEGIFESGMKNPRRQDIQSITKLLQNYGHVGEANIFYWFQNKKGRINKELPLESNGSSIREFSSSPMPPSHLLPEQMNGTSSAQYHNAVTVGRVIQSDSIMIHTELGAKKRNASLLTGCINGIPFDDLMEPRNIKALYHSSGKPLLVERDSSCGNCNMEPCLCLKLSSH